MRSTSVVLLLLFATSAAAQAPPPIIDMHLHALKADANGPPPLALCPGTAYPGRDPAQDWVETFTAALKTPPCTNPIWGATTDEEVMTQTLEVLERRNIIGVTSGSQLAKWRKAGGDRIVPALAFGGAPQSWPKPEEFRKRLQEGGYRAFAEVSIQYNGVSPSDPEFEPYLAIAEELDIPMGIHIGTGPPGAPYFPPFNWPKAIDYAIESITTAPFLTEEQKRDILYNNAARFLRLNDAAAR